jgi:nicotinate-nucleotide pyrophosphorylase (carboxylating)
VLARTVAAAFGLGSDAHALIADGSHVARGTVVATLAGPAAALRPAAEVLHGFISRLSGVAASARAHADALGAGRTRLLDDGTFTPAWRMIEKYALGRGGAWDGGCESGRIRLDSTGIAAHEIDSSVRRARETSPDLPVEITVRDGDAVGRAVAAAPDLIRLESLAVDAIRRAVACVNGRAFVEAHGGINLANIATHAGLGLDFVSIDSLVSDARWAPIEVIWRD